VTPIAFVGKKRPHFILEEFKLFGVWSCRVDRNCRKNPKKVGD
jgi:hypothetical protein